MKENHLRRTLMEKWARSEILVPPSPQITVLDPAQRLGYAVWDVHTSYRYNEEMTTITKLDLRWVFEEVTGWDEPPQERHTDNGRMDNGYPKRRLYPLMEAGGQWFLVFEHKVNWDTFWRTGEMARYDEWTRIVVHGKLRIAQPSFLVDYKGSAPMQKLSDKDMAIAEKELAETQKELKQLVVSGRK